MDVINRDELERKLAKLISKNQRAELDKLMNMLGDPPNIYNVPETYWTNGWKELSKEVEPVMMNIFMAQSEALMDDIGIGVDWGLVNTTALNWSAAHSEEILKKLFNTTYEGLTETIPQFYERGWTLGDLETALERWYSPRRAEMIAITETTRAAVEGEKALVELLKEESGIEMIPIWKTSKDERVCPICGPRADKPITDGIYPPLHPRCRCNVSYEFPKAEK